MLRYYPLTRVIQNQYTRGNQFVLPNGKPYSGRYYTLYTGESFTGVDPVLGTNIPLISIDSAIKRNKLRIRVPASNAEALASTRAVQSYNTATQTDSALTANNELTELTPYYPIPIESDYQRGYFTRYFAKTVSGPGYVFEISKLDWTKIQNGDVSETVLGYETVDMLWQLTGPLNNTRISQYQIKGGVYDTNKRVTEGKNKGFRGLIEFIGGDYTKFARITP